MLTSKPDRNDDQFGQKPNSSSVFPQAVTDGHQPVDDVEYIRLKTTEVELVIDIAKGRRPNILYWGGLLANTDADDLKLLSTRQRAHGGPAVDISPSLSNELAAGGVGAPGFVAHRDGYDWAAIFKTSGVKQPTANSVRIECHDENTQLRIVYELTIDPVSHVFMAKTSVTNLADQKLTIDWCAALCVPLDERLNRLRSFTGRWANEFQEQEISRFQGSYVRENKSGRTSHDSFPGLIALTDATDERQGMAIGLHLGWSGNHRVRVDYQTDGRVSAQMGELFHPSEMQLSSGETYTTPILFAAYTDQGLTHLSQQFHNCLSTNVVGDRINNKIRPVHYNTWEAIYFDQSEEKLLDLAEKAAAVGAERFVLDDGWFGGRRNDQTGLGDWWVSKTIYPNGLEFLADRVRALGMEFGIWFEPEMVNPDSDLYRAHPDWVLQAPGVEQIPSRGQYTLDLSKAEVSEYLFEKVSGVVTDLDVGYIKWDMNRDIHHPGSGGRGAVHRQTKAVYALIQRLRECHPALEIESCSSGGARADYGILQHTDRIWVSDSNDALDRQKIQRGASYFFPPKMLGCHVGPRECHITKRILSMELRAATAIFGHMGMELDLAEETPEDLETLRNAIALHKRHRALIHGGDFLRLDSDDHLNIVAVVSSDKDEALFSCAQLKGHGTTLPGRIRFSGLDRSKKYLLKIVWPLSDFTVTAPSVVDALDLRGEGCVLSGEGLAVHGLQLPLVYPESCIIFSLRAV